MNLNTHKYVKEISSRNINTLYISITALCLLFFVGAIFIKYPDYVTANVRLITDYQPFDLKAPTSGKILFLNNNKFVHADEILAYVDNPADFEAIQQLKHLLEKFSGNNFPSLLITANINELGEISYEYEKLNELIFLLNEELHDPAFKTNIQKNEILKKLISEQIATKKRIAVFQKQKLNISFENYETDSILFAQEAILRDKFQSSYASYLSNSENYYSLVFDNINLEVQLHNLIYQDKLLKQEKEKNLRTLKMQCQNQVNTILSTINAWETKYLIKSPISGSLEIQNFVENKQLVTQGEKIFKILPEVGELKGIINISNNGAGNISTMSPVKIFLDDYPGSENGYLVGSILTLSASTQVSDNGIASYEGVLNIDKNNQPYFSNHFNFQHNMTGTAKILTSDKRLIFQIIGWLDKMFN